MQVMQEKKAGRKLIAAVIAAALLVCVFPTVAYADNDKISELEEKIKQTQEEKEETEGKIDESKNELENLQNTTEGLKGQLNNLNSDLTQISENLAQLEEQISLKNAEIEKTNQELDEELAGILSAKTNPRYDQLRSDYLGQMSRAEQARAAEMNNLVNLRTAYLRVYQNRNFSPTA